MKKMKANINSWLDTLDTRWRELPLEKQYRYTWVFFLSYLILTLAVVLKVWYDTGKSNHNIAIKHIENSVLKKNESAKSLLDSLSMILKKQDK